MLGRLTTSLLLLTVTSLNAQQAREMSAHGELRGGGFANEALVVAIELQFGASLPPESTTTLSPFLRNIDRDAVLDSGKLLISRENLGQIDYQIDDVFAFGEAIEKASGRRLFIPISWINAPGNDIVLKLDLVSDSDRFFSESFPISEISGGALPKDNPMPAIRGLKIVIDEVNAGVGLSSCQLLDVYKLIRGNIEFFSEGDALVVKHVLDFLRLSNQSI